MVCGPCAVFRDGRHFQELTAVDTSRLYGKPSSPSAKRFKYEKPRGPDVVSDLNPKSGAVPQGLTTARVATRIC